MVEKHDINSYKKFFKSRKIRKIILNMLRFLPDSVMLRLQYRIKLGRSLNLHNPTRYTEKLQWYKMYYRNPMMHECVDKYNVREFVRRKGLENILIPLIAKYDSINHVDWDSLPNQFVIKTTNGGGGLNVAICNDKAKIDITLLKDRLTNEVIKSNTGGREWAYYGLKSRIIVEELLINKKKPEAGINDYKIFCYNGRPKYIIVDIDRYTDHKRNFYDVNWNNLQITSDCKEAKVDIEKPKNLEKMLKIASRLSEDFPYVRVDLYNCEDKIYFGELTFYPWSGYVQFFPDNADYLFGEDFDLNKYS